MRYAAFLRNIMIGREGMHRQVLLDFFEEHGAVDPVSYISTGNVGFSVAPGELDRLVADAESSIAAVLGRHEPLFIRSLERLTELVERDPFDYPEYPIRDRLVTLTQDTAELDIQLPYVADKGDYVVLEVSDREVYAATLDIPGRVRSPGGFIERLVGDKITNRSWNTIIRVQEKESARA